MYIYILRAYKNSMLRLYKKPNELQIESQSLD